MEIDIFEKYAASEKMYYSLWASYQACTSMCTFGTLSILLFPM